MKMNRIQTLLLVLLTWQGATAQNWLDLREQGANYYQIRDAFNRQYSGKMKEFKKELVKEAQGTSKKHDKFERQMEGMMQFMRWSNWVEPRISESQGDLSVINQGVVRAMVEQKRSMDIQTRAGASWSVVGPLSTPTSGGNGRVNAVRALPGSTTTFFACTPAGGLWKTTNSGASWTPISDAISMLGATDVGFDPTNSNIMYLLTGDGEAADTYSTGVYKSTDGGATWAATGALWTGTGTLATTRTTLSKILVNPTDGSILVGGSAGIYRSTNSGATWTRTSTLSVRDLEFKPGTPSVVYAGGYSANVFLRSNDGGVTWVASSATSGVGSGLPTTGTQRVAIAVTPLDPTYVYALVSNNTDYGLKGIYLSTDGGTSFTLKSSTPNVLGWNATGTDAGGQGWYDLSLIVDPSVKTTIYTGGVNIWKSTNSGTTMTCVGHWSGSGAPYEHADVHDLTFIGTTLYTGNDGGVFSLASGATNWADKSSNLAIAQIYGISLSTSNPNMILSGHQDNGTNLTTNLTSWEEVNGGDGMLCFIDRTNNNNKFSSLYYGALYRSTSTTSTSFGQNPIYSVPGAGWVTPWMQDPVSATTLYAGGTNVMKSTNLGTAWTAISNFTGVGTLVELDVATTNNQNIVAASATKVMKTTNGGTAWTDITAGLPAGVSILTVRFDVLDANKIYVGLASYAGQSVYMSTTGGTNWTNISAGLPSVPVNCFASQTNGDVYCGTDIGAYLRTSGATAWTVFTNGMPGVPVRDLEIYYPTNLIRAATFGRGIWSSPLNSATPSVIDAGIAGIVAPSGTITTASVTPSVTLRNFGTTTLTSATIFYKVDNGTESSTAWTGSIAPGGSATVALTSVTGYTAAAHTFAARTASPNGTTDANTTNDVSTSSFTYSAPVLTNDAGISVITTPSGTIATASVTPSVTLKNFGTATLTSATIFYKVDNGTEVSQAWTGSLASNATATVALNIVTGYAAGAHTFTVRTASPNAAVDANTANDALTSNFTYALSTVDASISAITTPSGTITTASVTPSVTLKNFGTATLTSATIFYKVDNGTEVSKAWTGSLASNATATVALNIVTGYAAGAHTFTVRTASPNAATDANTANDALTSNFTYALSTVDAGISAITTPSGTITTASVTPSVTLKNFGTTTLTSATIFYKVDNGTEVSKAWTGSLASNVTATVALNAVTGYAAGAHTFTARTASPNATTDANAANDALTSNFTYTVATACTNSNETTNNVATGATTILVNTTTNSQIGSVGDIDFYKFTTTTAAPKVQVKLSNLPDDYDITLYAATAAGAISTQLGTSINGGTAIETIKYNTATVGATYYVKVVGYGNAFSSSACYTLDVQASGVNFIHEAPLLANGKNIDETIEDVSHLSVYPNPVKDNFKIQFFTVLGGNYDMSFFDATGKRVLYEQKAFEKGKNYARMQTENLPKGIYLLVVKNENESLTQKVIVE